EIRMVQQVEELGAELQLLVLADRGVLAEDEVPAQQARANEAVALQIAKRAERLREECARIEPVLWCPHRGAGRDDHAATRAARGNAVGRIRTEARRQIGTIGKVRAGQLV